MNVQQTDLRVAGTHARPGADAERGRLQVQLRGVLGAAGADAAVVRLPGPGGRGGRVLFPPSAQPASPLAGRAVRDSGRRALPGAALAGRADPHAHDPKPQASRPVAAVRRHRQHEHRRRPAARRAGGYRQGRGHRDAKTDATPRPRVRGKQAPSTAPAAQPHRISAGLGAEEGPEPAGTAGQAVPPAGVPLRVAAERPLARTAAAASGRSTASTSPSS